MPGHVKGHTQPSADQQIATMPCWRCYLIMDRIYEIQAGQRVCIGNFSHCVRRYQSAATRFDITPMQLLNHPTPGCPDCRYETTTFKDCIFVYGWRTKLSRSTVLALMAAALDSGAARGGMELQSPGVTYTTAEALENMNKPKPSEEAAPAPAVRPAAMPAPISGEETY